MNLLDSLAVWHKTQYLRLRLFDSDFNALIDL